MNSLAKASALYGLDILAEEEERGNRKVAEKIYQNGLGKMALAKWLLSKWQGRHRIIFW